MKYPILGFYGAGNMAGAIIRGLLKSSWPAESMIACRRDITRLQVYSKLNLHITKNADQLAQKSDIIFLGMKPWQIEESCQAIAQHVRPGTVIVSLAAGITHKTIAKVLAKNSIVRAMPNIPVALCQGVTALYTTEKDHSASKKVAEVFSRLGYCFDLDNEDSIHSVVAISGSGPAYYFHILALMKEAAEKLGMESSVAAVLASHTMMGASYMAQENLDFASLRDQVVSKGGTTEAALKQLEIYNFPEAIEAALTACRDKSKELSGE